MPQWGYWESLYLTGLVLMIEIFSMCAAWHPNKEGKLENAYKKFKLQSSSFAIENSVPKKFNWKRNNCFHF